LNRPKHGKFHKETLRRFQQNTVFVMVRFADVPYIQGGPKIGTLFL